VNKSMLRLSLAIVLAVLQRMELWIGCIAKPS
jgi:hypothetical protein